MCHKDTAQGTQLGPISDLEWTSLIQGWTDKRNTGMKVTWFYTHTNDVDTHSHNKYLNDNKNFIRLAGVVHEKGQEFGETLLNQFRSVIKFEIKM